MRMIHRIELRSIPRLTVLVVALFTGCSNLLDADSQIVKEGRITITGNSPVPLRLITSIDFTAAPDPFTGVLEVSYIIADSTLITLPFDKTYTFEGTDRFVVRLENTDTASTATFNYRIILDGKECDQNAGTMKNSSLQIVCHYPNQPF